MVHVNRLLLETLHCKCQAQESRDIQTSRHLSLSTASLKFNIVRRGPTVYCHVSIRSYSCGHHSQPNFACPCPLELVGLQFMLLPFGHLSGKLTSSSSRFLFFSSCDRVGRLLKKKNTILITHDHVFNPWLIYYLFSSHVVLVTEFLKRASHEFNP